MTTRSVVRVVVRRAEGVLVRVLGVTVRRGFEPVAVTSVEGTAPGTFDIEMTVESTRPVAVLARHLANLYDVDHVAVREGSDPEAAVS